MKVSIFSYLNNIYPHNIGGSTIPEIMTTNAVAEYLKHHPTAICKYAAQGAIPGNRIGRVWRFEKDVIDKWIAEGHHIPSISKGAKK